MKLRLLNTSHLAIAALGQLAGEAYVDEVMQDALFRRFMKALMDRETGTTLTDVPGIDLNEYKRALVARFANPSIKDTVRRICKDAPLNYLLDPLKELLDDRKEVPLLALSLAAWIRRLQGKNDRSEPIVVEHPLAQELRARARSNPTDARPVLALRSLFGDLCHNSPLVEQVGGWLKSLKSVGALATIGVALGIAK